MVLIRVLFEMIYKEIMRRIGVRLECKIWRFRNTNVFYEGPKRVKGFILITVHILFFDVSYYVIFRYISKLINIEIYVFTCEKNITLIKTRQQASRNSTCILRHFITARFMKRLVRPTVPMYRRNISYSY